MCGIIGYSGENDAVGKVIAGLKLLEYRGYDSAGVAYLNGKGIEVKRCKGKIRDLEALVPEEIPQVSSVIGHTRWATHGVPAEVNAHPHISDDIVLVHNGIIENYLALKPGLIEKGYNFTSETDTEVICHLIDSYHKTMPLEEAVRMASKEVKGSYAVVVFSRKEGRKMVGIRKDSPLVLGIGEKEFFLASDVPAFLTSTRKVLFLEDDELVVIEGDSYRIMGVTGKSIERAVETINWSPSMADKGGYRHYMLKEIHEQPMAIADTLRGRILPEKGEINIREFGLEAETLKAVERIFIGACGTSWHAALAGKYMIEQLARVPVDVELASEFRYREPLIGRGDLFIAITQSGETADTLAAQREAGRRGADVLSICNVLGATSAREADSVFYTHTGPEIGVASTKAFSSQLLTLYLFSLALAGAKSRIGKQEVRNMVTESLKVPDILDHIIKGGEVIEKVARDLFKAGSFLYLGRGILYPIALEGALKLKEISYIHAEGYPAGEMKHGPIALVDEEIPLLFLAQRGPLREKIFSNMSEVKARGGRTVLLISGRGEEDIPNADYIIDLPSINQYLEPMLMAVPLQLLAYHIGVLRGCDVDQPRNLAKSVTVE